jgi:hypothetical protein
MFGELIKSFAKEKAKAKQREEYELTPHDLELQDIWDSLDPELKDFAKTTRSIGLGHNARVRFNERGMAELVYQLAEIGYEIKKKENTK